MFSFFKKFSRFSVGFTPHSAGLTLIEMVVVIAIFAIVTLVLLAGLPSFRDRTSLDLVAEEVALVVRQAQVFGVATREFGSAFPSHGVFFNPADDRSLILFGDAPIIGGGPTGDGVYDLANQGRECDDQANTECREVYRLQGGVYIDSIEGCTPEGGEGEGWENCFGSNGTNVVNISFVRPYQDAVFGIGGGGLIGGSRLVLVLKRTGRDDARGVVIWRTGHIYACNPATNDPDICYAEK